MGMEMTAKGIAAKREGSSMRATLCTEDKEQLNRIEEKLDILIGLQEIENGDTVPLEEVKEQLTKEV